MTSSEFSGVVRQYQKLVYTICYQLVQDPQTAEDLTQETFLAAYTHIDRCAAEYLKPWLAKIAANKARDHLKSAWNRKVSTPGDDALPVLPAGPPGEVHDPEALAVSADEAQAIRRMVMELKEPYWQVATLYFLQQKTVEEIAQRTQRPPKTVYTQLHRARQLLQKRILERRETQ